MKKRYYLIILVLFTIVFVLLINGSVVFRSANLTPKEEPNLRLETKDSKKDGGIDNWVYRDKKGVPVKWIRDSNHDGRPDKWAFFKNGRAFLDEEDTDHDGRVDQIQLSLVDAQGYKQRFINLALKDKRTNTFEVQFDTRWVTEKNFEKVK
jgi:hypothetical protein